MKQNISFCAERHHGMWVAAKVHVSENRFRLLAAMLQTSR